MDAQVIGETAGKVWRFLAATGGSPVAELAKGVSGDPAIVHMALGWLSREDKLVLERQGKAIVVRLKESELLQGR